jgi:hypothetical protein
MPAEMHVSVSENFQIWRWIGFLFFRIKKSSGGEGVSMSGFERLDRLSLPRRARRHAIAQDNRNGRLCNPAAFASLSRNISAPTRPRILAELKLKR